MLELFYRNRGFPKVQVNYAIAGNHLRLAIDEGTRVTVNEVTFAGNKHFTVEQLFKFATGPTREHSNTVAGALPFVPDDLTEGADLVRRLYISDGFLHVVVQELDYRFVADVPQVNVRIAICEGLDSFFCEFSLGCQPTYRVEKRRQDMPGVLHLP